MKIALIPAKLNSTRVKNKNFRMFNGKPMIFWSIETAKKSKLFDKIVVTTDNQIVKNKLSKLAVDVFIRPKKLSQEKIGIRDVVDHFLKNIEYQIENGIDDNLIENLVEGGADFTSTDKYINNVRRLLWVI